MRVRTRLATIMVGLALAAPLGAQEPALPSPVPPPNPMVLTVNGSPVYAAEVALVMQSVAMQAKQAGVEMSQDELIGAGTRQVVETRLLAQEARRREIQLDREAVEETMARIEQQNGGRSGLEASLGRGGMSYQQFRIGVEENQLVAQLINTSIRSTVAVSDEEVAEFYRSNPERFDVPERVRARHILFTVELADSDEKKAAARAKAEAARQRVLGGEDFAAVASEVSQCPSAAQGGDLGFFSAEEMLKPFADVAFALEPGATSSVVETQFGFHVIRLEERQPAGQRSLDEARDRIRNGLERDKVTEAVARLLEKLTTEATVVEAPGLEE